MKKLDKKIIGSSIIVAAFASTFLIGCNQSGKSRASGYNVTYHAGDGYKISGKQDFTATNVKEIKAEPTPDYSSDSKFLGWYYSTDPGATQVQFPKTISANMDFYAKWEKTQPVVDMYTVKFNVNNEDATKVPNYLVEKGKTVASSPHTTLEAHKLLGWKDTKSTSTDYVEFPYTPTQDTTLVAEWEENEFKAILHTDGSMPKGYEQSEAEKVYVSKSYEKEISSIPATTYTDRGFEGWYDNPEFEGEPVTFPYKLSAKKRNLYAKFNASGEGKSLTLIDEVHEFKTETIENSTNIPYQPGALVSDTKKTFKGWASTSGATTPDVKFPLTLSSDKTIYAVWEDRAQRTITFKDNDKTVKTETYYEGQVVNDPPDMPDETYKKFDGWFDENNVRIKFPHSIGDSDETFYAHTSRSRFDFRIIDSENDQTVIYNSSITGSCTLPSTVVYPVKGRENDYTFDGFYYNKECTGTKIDAGHEYVVGKSETESLLKNNVLDIYVKWKDRNYQIAITVDEGLSPQIIYHSNNNRKKVKDLPKYTETHHEKKVKEYVVLDPNTGEETSTKYDPTTHAEVELPLAEIKLKIIWESKYRDITVYRGGAYGEAYTSEQVQVEDGVTKLSDLSYNSKTNYTLKGYYVNEEPTSESTPEALTSTIDKTWTCIYEAWELNSAKLKINYYGDANKALYLGSTTKNKSPLTFKYSDIAPQDYTDYNDWTSLQVNNGSVIKKETEKDPQISLTGYENVIDVCLKQTKFTVKYELGYETTESYIQEHVNKFINIIPKSRGSKYAFNGWYYNGEKYTGGEEITEDITVYAEWTDLEVDLFDVKFSVGSSQLLATFANGEKELVVSSTASSMSPSEFPIATCEGNRFAGWFDAEVGGKEYTLQTLTKDDHPNTLYAHWTPTEGSISICLKIDGDGRFKNGGQSAIMTVQPGKRWADIKQYVPETEYTSGEFIVGGWKDKDGNQIGDRTQFNNDQFIYAVKEKNAQTPSGNFEYDNWATVIAVANNEIKKNGLEFANGLKALQGWYPELKVGDTKVIGLEGTKCHVTVIGLGQDYGNSGLEQKLPITFEFEKLLYVSEFNTNDSVVNYSNSSLRTKLNTGGAIYSRFPEILTNYIPTTYKQTLEKDSSGWSSSVTVKTNECKMFIPSLYELNVLAEDDSDHSSFYDKFNNSQNKFFKYEYYTTGTITTTDDRIMKTYLDLGACNYWTRDYRQSGDAVSYLKIKKATSTGTTLVWESQSTSFASAGRGVNAMFCLGSPYIP